MEARPSAGEEPQEVNDENQYDKYYEDLKSLRNPFSAIFPVSEDSVEFAVFREDFADMVRVLNRFMPIQWSCITCVGMVHGLGAADFKIRTTVRSRSAVCKGTRMKMRPRTDMWGGDDPLVSGSSCEVWGAEGTGTIGGFIRIEDDPDKDAVYAVTNHHVISNNHSPIPWQGFKSLEQTLQIPEQISKSLAILGLKSTGRDGIFNILDIVETAESDHHTTTNPKEEYLSKLASQYFGILKRRSPEDPDCSDAARDKFTASLREMLPAYKGTEDSFNDLLAELRLTDCRKLMLKDMASSAPKPHGYVLGLFIQSIPKEITRFLNRGHQQRKYQPLRHLIHYRRIQRIGSRLSNTERLVVQRPSSKEHDRGPERIIGMVWASSGLIAKPIPETTWCGSGKTREDWALIKLFRGRAGPSFTSRCTTNPLRPTSPAHPNQQGDHFRGVVPWNCSRVLGVQKRGATTNVTAGKTNGADALVCEGGYQDGFIATRESVIVADLRCPAFSSPGDSGSWCMDEAGQLLGMLWGGLGRITFFTPADQLFCWIEQEFILAMEKHAGVLNGDPLPGRRIKICQPIAEDDTPDGCPTP
ncbi:hypothetical protein QBC46DRAFT_411574 [Diplogelasinospora grovesii]|uniref:Uncharacterized protein n=1 Tax=Diplogelasinospora grovesii TaxID=303347 RepID=A0AAN6N347_9PEZI|nr:hypothetical protein QBC46DRAFT_411574 [Diplogelasinospora grovesii]